jgi:hypothetical protein
MPQPDPQPGPQPGPDIAPDVRGDPGPTGDPEKDFGIPSDKPAVPIPGVGNPDAPAQPPPPKNKGR